LFFHLSIRAVLTTGGCHPTKNELRVVACIMCIVHKYTIYMAIYLYDNTSVIISSLSVYFQCDDFRHFPVLKTIVDEFKKKKSPAYYITIVQLRFVVISIIQPLHLLPLPLHDNITTATDMLLPRRRLIFYHFYHLCIGEYLACIPRKYDDRLGINTAAASTLGLRWLHQNCAKPP